MSAAQGKRSMMWRATVEVTFPDTRDEAVARKRLLDGLRLAAIPNATFTIVTCEAAQTFEELDQ